MCVYVYSYQIDYWRKEILNKHSTFRVQSLFANQKSKLATQTARIVHLCPFYWSIKPITIKIIILCTESPDCHVATNSPKSETKFNIKKTPYTELICYTSVLKCHLNSSKCHKGSKGILQIKNMFPIIPVCFVCLVHSNFTFLRF